jgi:putative membrane protein
MEVLEYFTEVVAGAAGAAVGPLVAGLVVAVDSVGEELQVTGKIPRWLKSKINSEGIDSIIKSIQLAETKTDVEFVPLIVKQSLTTISLVHLVIRLIFLLLIVLSFELFLKNLWLTWQMESVIFISLIVALFYLTYPLARLNFVLKSLLKKSEIDLCIERRAIVEFYANKMDQTASRTVVLLMISVLEKRAIILADPSLNLKVDSKIWSDAVKVLIESAHEENLAGGLEKVITQLSHQLASVVPYSKKQLNEYPDVVLIKE